MKFILSRLAPYRWRMLVGFCIKVAGTVAELMLPVILTHILENVIADLQVERVVLFGGESNVRIFKSQPCSDFCALPQPVSCEYNLPTAYVEVVSPIILDTKIVEKVTECNCNCCCCCQENDLPDAVLSSLNEPLMFDGDERHQKRYLTVSLGLFSVVRLVRPTQLLVQATEYCIPEKECASVEDDNPCRVFHSMPFPVNEFCTQAYSPCAHNDHPARCGCGS